jgi:hypothetical protein
MMMMMVMVVIRKKTQRKSGNRNGVTQANRNTGLLCSEVVSTASFATSRKYLRQQTERKELSLGLQSQFSSGLCSQRGLFSSS